MQELVFLFAEEWGWSKRDLIVLSGGEILDLIRRLNKNRRAKAEAIKNREKQQSQNNRRNKRR